MWQLKRWSTTSLGSWNKRRNSTGKPSNLPIFGTLYERSLDPSKRSQLGAHYTSREDILLIVERS